MKSFMDVFRISNRMYDILKWLVIIVLPATATFLLTVGQIWGIPMIEQIVSTVTAITTFLGAIMCISTMQYNKRNK